VLNRTFGCVRVVWNQTLAARQHQYATDRTVTSYAQTDRALTAMKKEPDLAFLNEVSSVPLQQALRHQHRAFTAFFARRASYPRFKSRHARQCAHYTRAAFTMRDGLLRLAKTGGRLRFRWSCVRAPTRRTGPIHPDVAMAVLRHPARPGHQRR
jgi:putative transposase